MEKKLDLIINNTTDFELKAEVKNLSLEENEYIEILNKLTKTFEYNIETCVIIQIAKNIMADRKKICF